MAVVPTWMVDQKKIEAAVHRAEAALKPEVVHIRYSLEDDWSGDPAVFFRVLLSDEAVPDLEAVYPLSEKIREKIVAEVNPYDQGLLPYFNFRTVKEQRMLKEKVWD